MNKNTEFKINYKLSLIDIMYGVILTIGFVEGSRINVFQVNTVLKYLLAYTIIIIDWLHVHEVYSKEGYSSIAAFILDLLILYIISRIIIGSLKSSNYLFWIYMSALFILYSIWDIVMLKANRHSLFNFKNAFKADLFDSIACLFCFFSINNRFINNEIYLTISFIPIYIVTIIIWEKKRRSKNPRGKPRDIKSTTSRLAE